MDKKVEETLLKVADYSNEEKESFSKKIKYVFWVQLLGMGVYMAIDVAGLSDMPLYGAIIDLVLGLMLGGALTGLLYSSRYIARIKAAKMRLLKRSR